MNTLIAILTMLPLVLGLVEKWVQVVETPDLDGPAKKQLVTDAVLDSLNILDIIPGIGSTLPIMMIKPLIGPMIDMTVRIMNTTKKFTKKDAAGV